MAISKLGTREILGYCIRCVGRRVAQQRNDGKPPFVEFRHRFNDLVPDLIQIDAIPETGDQNVAAVRNSVGWRGSAEDGEYRNPIDRRDTADLREESESVMAGPPFDSSEVGFSVVGCLEFYSRSLRKVLFPNGFACHGDPSVIVGGCWVVRG